MLWSLIKIVVFVAIIAFLTWLAGYLGGAEGGLRVAFAGYELNLGPLQAAIALAVLVVGVWLLLKVIGLLIATVHFLNGDETAISRYFDRNRERRGFDALSEGLMALASGEGDKALVQARRADRYLDRPELTGLLTAQAAEMAGDRAKAEATYRELVQHDKTRFVGVRGLMHQRLRDGDTAKAMMLAEKAFALRPKNAEVQDALLKMQTEKGDWGAARKTLEAKLKSGHLPRDVHKRRDAILALSEARGVTEGEIRDREAAIEANRLSPDLVPAAVLAARAYIADGKKKYALRVLAKAWEAQPHPDLAQAFAEMEPNESPAARVKRFETLTKIHPSDPETRMLRAELLIAAEDFPGARRALGDLATTHPTVRSLTLMAAIEKGEGASETVVRAWLARAVTAPRGPVWTCSNCHNIPGDWVPVCPNCGAFDTLEWVEPPAQETVIPGAGMLPLIVGPDTAPDAAEAAEAEVVLVDPEEARMEGRDRPTRPAVSAGGDAVATDVSALPGADVDVPPPVEPANPAPGAPRT